MIKKYRKLPVEIEAMQFTDESWDGIDALRAFVGDNNLVYTKENLSPCKNPLPIIRTLEGDMVASVGDYIIKGINGEFYPCKPDIFNKTYELVE